MRLSRASAVAIALVFAVFTMPFSSVAAEQAEELISILEKKEVITKEEAATLRKPAKVPAQPAKAGEGGIKEDWTKNMEVGYNKGAYVKTKDGRFSLLMNVRLQGQYNYQFLDDRDDTSTFQVKRARLITSGNAFHPWLKYFVQLTLEQSVNLRDAYIEAAYFKWLTPTFGQYKVPFDREFLTSAFNLQLIERSIANTEFNLGRDVGLQIAGFPLGEMFEYRLGIFNGSGANQDNINNNYMYVGRFVFTPLGPYPYSQAALDTPKKPLLAVGAAGAYLPGLEPTERRTLAGRLGSTQVVPVRSDVYQYTADLAFKLLNFSFEGGYYYRTIDPRVSTPFGRQNGWGYFAQAGYFIIPKHFEVAGRYSYLNPDNPVRRGNNNQYELTGGVSYYFEGHPLKIQANYSYIKTQATPSDLKDHIVRSQVTLMF